MRRRRSASDLRTRLIEHQRGYERVHARYARLMGEPSPAVAIIAALERGEPVTMAAWQIAAAVPELGIALDLSAPDLYVVDADGSLTPVEVAGADG